MPVVFVFWCFVCVIFAARDDFGEHFGFSVLEVLCFRFLVGRRGCVSPCNLPRLKASQVRSLLPEKFCSLLCFFCEFFLQNLLIDSWDNSSIEHHSTS